MEPLQHSISAITLLFAEDDKETSKIAGLMLAMKFPEIAIYFADNGRSGVELCKEHKTDIVITDINMPVLDGHRMAVEIKAIKSDTLFIVLTGYSDKKYLERFNEIGLSGRILKPIDFKKLFTAIEKCIGQIMLKRQLTLVEKPDRTTSRVDVRWQSKS